MRGKPAKFAHVTVLQSGREASQMTLAETNETGAIIKLKTLVELMKKCTERLH